MAYSQDVLTRIINVNWGSEIVALNLGFDMFKPVRIGDWIGHLTMTTSVTGLPALSTTSFRVVAQTGLPGETQNVSGEWVIDGKTITGSATLSSDGRYTGVMAYRFAPGSVSNSLVLQLTGTAPRVVDRNLEPMDVPIDLYVTGIDTAMSNPFAQEHRIIAGGGRFIATFEVQIRPPSMSLTLT